LWKSNICTRVYFKCLKWPCHCEWGNIHGHFRSGWMSMSMHVHVQWPTKSLESKWGVIKHNKNKFGDVYNVIISLNERKSNLDDTLQTITWTPQVQAH
jgi:hypothetical protein